MAAFALVLATSGISNTHFAGFVQTSLQRIAGPSFVSTIGNAKLSLDSTGNLAFRVDNVVFSKANDRTQIANIKSLKMGMNALPLLFGKVEIARLEIDDVVLSIQGDVAQPNKWMEQLKRPDGLFDPGKLPALAHDLSMNLRNQFKDKRVSEVLISKVEFVAHADLVQIQPVIQSLSLSAGDNDSVLVDGKVQFVNQTAQITGEIAENGFELSVNGLKYGVPTSEQITVDAPDSTVPIKANGTLKAMVRGLFAQNVPRLKVELEVEKFDYRNKRGARVAGQANVSAELVQDIDKIEIDASKIEMGTNAFEFTGAVGPEAQGTTSNPAYRFELVSNDSSLSPKDSPERRISAAAKIAGNYNAVKNEIDFSQISVRTLGGEVFGQGNVKFGVGSPEMIFSLTVPEMSVADAKQLWPSIVAGGARQWVLDHVYGGTLTDSKIYVAMRAGEIWPLPEGFVAANLTADQVSADFTINNARFDVIGDLPAVRDAFGTVQVRGANTIIKVSEGVAYLENNKTVNVANGVMNIPVVAGSPVIGQLSIDVSGEASSIADVADKEPIRALSSAPVAASDLSGTAIAHIEASFPLRKADSSVAKKWNAEVEFENLTIAKEFSGQKLSEANGTLSVSKSLAIFKAAGKLNGLPATLSVTEPLKNGDVKREVKAELILDDKARVKIAPGLKDFLTGPVSVSLAGSGNSQAFEADLTDATLSFPWAGWSKGAGVAAQAKFQLVKDDKTTSVKNLEIKGKSFSMSGDVELAGNSFSSANFSKVSLNKGDNIAIAVKKGKDGYVVDVTGTSLDLRALLKKVTGSFEKTAASTGGVPIRVNATLDSVYGFNDERLQNVVASYSGKGAVIRSFTASATSKDGGNIAIENKSDGNRRTVQIQATDGGALLRFVEIYDKMQGGTVGIALATNGDGPLVGEVDARSFVIAGEPRLKSLVGAPVNSDGTSLSKIAKDKIQVSKVKFERGNALIEKGKGYLKLDRGILRSEQIGLSYSGTLYDPKGRIDMVGTFMPAFGLNRLFSELPIFGELLGNGRDKGLIGITFKLAGNAKSPELTVNPVSLIAPGFFRQIFEFQ